MKKTILSIIVGILVGTMANVLASSLLASSIEYHPKDSKWNVSNVEAAIDSLYYYDTIKTPVGEIINYMGTIVPEHYLECDGKTYNISDYPKLAEQIKTNFGTYNHFGGNGTTTFAVPDLRGEFLRGSGTNSHSGEGSGESVGVHQDGTLHNGSYVADYGRATYTPLFGKDIRVQKYDSAVTGSNELNILSGSYQTNSSWTSIIARYTSRPTNTSVMYAIRYE